MRIDPGFDPNGVLTMVVSVAGTKEADPGVRANFFREALERVRAVPGVRAAGAINHLPLAGDEWGVPFFVEGRPHPEPADVPGATFRAVLPGYHETMRAPLLRGRAVNETDVLGARDVVVINEWMARRHWPGEDPIGKRISFSDPRDSSEVAWLTVVGVVRDAARTTWAGAPREEVFVPYLQQRRYLEGEEGRFHYLTFVVRGGGEPAVLAPAVREAVWSIDRDVTLAEVQTMSDVVAEANARPRFYLLLLTVFAGVALALAALGVYGVMSHAVSRRTREIGIRVALGARRGDALGLVVGQTMAIAGAGVAAGVFGAYALTRLMAAFLYGVGPTDPLTFAAAAAVLLVAALAASWIPARRATHVDPVIALRAE
jgi:putative ABC transport system permease protein